MKKTIEEKISQYFSSFSLNLPEKYAENKLYLYADYIEMVALFFNSSPVSVGEILSRFTDEGIFPERKSNQKQEEQNQKNEDWVRKMFKIAEERSLIFGHDYPFHFKQEKLKLKENLSERNKLYIFLLLASDLSTFSDFQHELTSEFEKISYEALKGFLPRNSVLKQFGKNSDYSGNAISKIRSLAADLGLGPDEINNYEINSISDRNTQEKGLDIIGWIPFNDNCMNVMIILGQCACGKKWSDKYHETRRYEEYLQFYKLRPCHSIFTSYALINQAERKFYPSGDIVRDTLVFERKRILSLVDENLIDQLESRFLIDRCIEFEEDIV